MSRFTYTVGRQKRKAREFAKALSSSNRELDAVKARLATALAENRALRQELDMLLRDRNNGR